jgi:WD40 repeat protein
MSNIKNTNLKNTNLIGANNIANRPLIGHEGYINAIKIILDDKYIVSASKDCTIRIWERNSGNTLNVLKGHRAEITSVTISNDNSLIVSGAKDSSVLVWNFWNGKLQ